MTISRRTLLCWAVGILGAIAVCGAIFWRVWIPKTSLPAVMPSSFTLVWQSGGGMDPSGADVTLRGTSGAARVWSAETSPAASARKNFTLSDEDANAIYQYLRTHGADTIVVEDSGIVDGNNDGYDLSWDDTAVHVWGMAVADADQERFREIYQHLRETFTQYLPVTL